MTGRSGAILLETMLALAIFVMAATAVLVHVDQSLTGLVRGRSTEQACEVAKSAMSRLEAGLDTPRTLNGPVKGGAGTEFVTPPGKWELKIESEPSEFTGLTRVTVTARLVAEKSDGTLASYTLRQLVRLGARAKDRPGEDDVMTGMGANGHGRGEDVTPVAPNAPTGATGATGTTGGEL